MSCIAVANRTNKTMIDHYPINSKTNGCTLKKHSMVMVQWFQNHWKQSKYSGLKKLNFIAYIFHKFWLVFDQNHKWLSSPKKAQIIFPKKSLSHKWSKTWRKQKKPCKRVSIFFLVQQNKCIKIKQMGWLEGFWDGTICWNLSICMLIFQHKAADFSSYFFPNTIN